MWVLILEDRHVDVHIEVYSTPEKACERFDELVELYGYYEENNPKVEGWLRSAPLSSEGDFVRVEEVELDTPTASRLEQ